MSKNHTTKIMVEKKILSVMSDNFLDYEFIAYKAGLSNETTALALNGLTKDLTVVKYMGRYKRVTCPGDIELSLSGQTELIM